MLSLFNQRTSMGFLLSVMVAILSLPLTCGTGLAFGSATPGGYGRPYVFGRFYQYDTNGSKWDADFPYRVSEQQFNRGRPSQDGLTRDYRKPNHQPLIPYPRYDSVKLYRDSSGCRASDRNAPDRKCSSKSVRCRGKY
jgi:hypothetical protein